MRLEVYAGRGRGCSCVQVFFIDSDKMNSLNYITLARLRVKDSSFLFKTFFRNVLIFSDSEK